VSDHVLECSKTIDNADADNHVSQDEDANELKCTAVVDDDCSTTSKDVSEFVETESLDLECRTNVDVVESVQDSECIHEDTVVIDNVGELEDCPDSWEDMDLTTQNLNSEYKFLDNNSFTTQSGEPIDNISSSVEHTEPGTLRFLDNISTIEQDNSTTDEGVVTPIVECDNSETVEPVIDTTLIEQESSESSTPSEPEGDITKITDNCCYLVLPSSSDAPTDSPTSSISTDPTSILDVHGSVSQPPTLTEADILFTSKLDPTAREFSLNPFAKEFVYEKTANVVDGSVVSVQQQEECYSQTYIPYVGLNNPPTTNTTTTNDSEGDDKSANNDNAPVIQHHPTPQKQFYTWSYVNSGHGFYYGIPTPLELFSANGSYYFAAAQPQVNEQMQQILQQNGLPIPTDTSDYTHARQFYVMHQSVQYAPNQQNSLSADRFVERLLEEQAMLTEAAQLPSKDTEEPPKEPALEDSKIEDGSTEQMEFTESDPAIYQTAFPSLTDNVTKIEEI